MKNHLFIGAISKQLLISKIEIQTVKPDRVCHREASFRQIDSELVRRTLLKLVSFTENVTNDIYRP